MSDLISRSALLESLIHCDGLGRKSCEAVIKTIEEQPTAYDVEQVVKELEENSFVDYCEEYVDDGELLIATNVAIYIVKKVGGMNERDYNL